MGMPSSTPNLGLLGLGRTLRRKTWVISPIPLREKAHFSSQDAVRRIATLADASCNTRQINSLHFGRDSEQILRSAVGGMQ